MAADGKHRRLWRRGQQQIKNDEPEQAFRPRRRAVGLRTVGRMRVPGKGVPEDSVLRNSERVEGIPYGGSGGFAPGNVAGREPQAATSNTRHRTRHDEALTGEGNSGDAAPLVAGSFSNQNLGRLNAQVCPQTFPARRRTIERAVIALVTLRPGIEDVWSAIGGQKPEEARRGVKWQRSSCW